MERVRGTSRVLLAVHASDVLSTGCEVASATENVIRQLKPPGVRPPRSYADALYSGADRGIVAAQVSHSYLSPAQRDSSEQES